MRATFQRTDVYDMAIVDLVEALDLDLEGRYGPQEDFRAKKNQIDVSVKPIVAYADGRPVGLVCYRPFDEKSAELKRTFVVGQFRNRGIGKGLVEAIEAWATEEGFRRMVLETGTSQPEAISLYEKLGYRRIDNFPPYEDAEISICMAKYL